MQACIVHHDGTILNTCSYGGGIQLGYLLNKVCMKEDVQLVNIVRKQEQVDLLTKLGANTVYNQII